MRRQVRQRPFARPLTAMLPPGDHRHIRFQAFALSAGAVLMAVKFAAFGITGSNAILSDALESIINVVAGAFALYSLILAAKPRDYDHPYGHGKIEFLSAGLEGTLIVLAGAAIVYQSVHDLLQPSYELTSLDIGIWLTAAAGAVNYLLGWFTERFGRTYLSVTMIASGKHLKSDAYTSLGLVTGLAVVMLTGVLWLDAVIAIGFGVFIAWTGFREVRKSLAGIMDEADFGLIAGIIDELEDQRNPHWIDLHNLRVIKFGKLVHVDCHVTMPHYLTVKQAHDQIDLIEKTIAAKHPEGLEMFVHADPCLPSSCRICTVKDCPVRTSPFEQRVDWGLDNVTLNRKH
ncbi:MAG: cation diffusion facilitator family transporter [Flavobacteriales bacterium]|nr:cation diffusion facilitator family transporter [Flavobacteriales bacterium]